MENCSPQYNYEENHPISSFQMREQVLTIKLKAVLRRGLLLEAEIVYFRKAQVIESDEMQKLTTEKNLNNQHHQI